MCFPSFRLVLKSFSQKSHLKVLRSFCLGFSAGGEEEDDSAACWSIRLLGGSPFSSTRCLWYARSLDNYFSPFFFFFISARYLESVVGALASDFKTVQTFKVVVTFPFLYSSRREHSLLCFTFFPQHWSKSESAHARVPSWEKVRKKHTFMYNMFFLCTAPL